MGKSQIDMRDLPTQILTVLAERGATIVTSRDLQMTLPRAIEARYGQQVMPETVARVFRKMKETGDDYHCVIADSRDVTPPKGRTYTEWTIKEIMACGTWTPWSTFINQ